MVEQTHTRIDNTIITKATGHKEEFKYINEAKRKSRQIQLEADKMLGRGSVRVG